MNLITSSRIYFFLTLLCLPSCGILHFSDVQLPPGIETFSINVTSETAEGPIDIDTKLSDALQEKIMRDTHLIKSDQDSDMHYECVVKAFAWEPVFTTQSRAIYALTITLAVSYETLNEELETFKEKYFSISKESAHPTQDEAYLLEEIMQELATEIWNASIGRW